MEGGGTAPSGPQPLRALPALTPAMRMPYRGRSAPCRRKQEEDEPDPEQVRKDMERLQMIKDKREKERQARIAKEGWDRFAPVSETNKPPGGAPRPADD